MKKIRIAILGTGFIDWGGGIEFIRYVLNALTFKAKTNPIQIYLILPQDLILARLCRRFVFPIKQVVKSLIDIKLPRLVYPQQVSITDILDMFQHVYGEYEIVYYNGSISSLEKQLKVIRADVVIPSVKLLGKDFSVPWIGYVYDFQHKYYPDFFTKREIKSRDKFFTSMLHEAQAVIVNAQAVKADIEKFVPDRTAEVFVLPFAPAPVEEWFDSIKEDMFVKYGLPKRYFMISNQFWIHKSHATAFEALKIFHDKTQQLDIKIVCTGNTYDNRFPDYFQKLKAEISGLDLIDKIIFLGHIPKIDQINIMKNCIAVLQPTLFEGGPGGGMVYDAVALGVDAIVSDISVNMEIKEDNILFFKTGCSNDMAEKMLKIFNNKRKQEKQNKEILLSKSYERIERLGETLVNAISLIAK